MVDELEDFLKNNDIEIAAPTLPKSKAIEVADILVDNGERNLNLHIQTFPSKGCGR